jgi:hypothetical protein
MQMGSNAEVLSPEQIAKNKQHDFVIKSVDSQIKDYESQFDFADRLAIRLGKGWTRNVANGLLDSIVDLQETITKLKNERQVEAISGESDLIHPGTDIDAAIAFNEQRLADLQKEYHDAATAVAKPTITSDDGKLRTVPEHPIMLALQAAQDAGDQDLVDKLMVTYFAETAAETALPSITQGGFQQLLIPGGLGAVGRIAVGNKIAARVGFTAGTGVSSAYVEGNAAFAQYLQEQNVDLGNPLAVEAAISDPKIVSEAKSFAKKRKIAVGMFDMLGGYLATKNIVPPGLKSKIGRFISNAGAQMVQQPLTGGAGEVFAQFAADQPYSALDAKLELLGELPSAAVEPVIFAVADKLGKSVNDFDTIEKVLDEYIKNDDITEAEVLHMMREVAENGMSDEDAETMLRAVFGAELDVNLLSMREETVSNFNTPSQLKEGTLRRQAIEATRLTDVKGDIKSGEEVLHQETPDGNVYWATPMDNPGSSTSSRAVLEAQETLSQMEAIYNAALAQKQDVTAINALANEIENQRENIQKLQKIEKEMSEVRGAMHEFVQEFINTYLPGQDLIVLEDNAIMDELDKSLHKTNRFGFSAHIVSQQTQRATPVMFLNIDTVLGLFNDQRGRKDKVGKQEIWASVLLHELGHTVATDWVRRLPAVVISAIKAEHRKFVRDAVASMADPITEIFNARMNPSLFDGLFADIPGTKLGESDGVLSYLLSLDEFIADALARQFSRPDSPISPMIDRHLPRLGVIMQSQYEKYKNLYHGDETYGNFLTYLKLRAEREAIEGFKQNFSEVELKLPVGQAGEVMKMLSAAKGLDIPKSVEDRLNDNLDRYNWIMRAGLTLLQLGKENKHIPGLQKYIKVVHEHWVTKSNWNDQAMKTINEWRKLGKGGDELGRFLLELTVKSDELSRRLTNDEIEQLLKDKNFKLSPQAWKVYLRVRGDLQNALEQLYILEKNRLQSDHVDAPSILKTKLLELDNLFDNLRNRDYFPLSRFGEWGIAMKAEAPVQIDGRAYVGGETVHFELFENKRQRNKAIGRLQRKFGRKVKPHFVKIEEDLKPFTGLPVALFSSLKHNPKLGLTESQKNALQDMIDVMSPTQGIAKRMLERKGTEGFHRDATRGYANYMLQMGSHIAKMMHVGDMDAAIDSVRTSARYLGSQGIINDKRHEIAEHMIRHQEYMLRPEAEWGGLRAAAFHWFLGYNVKSALVNLTQVPLVAYPYLAARKELTGGLPGKSDAVAIAALTKAMVDISSIFRGRAARFTMDEEGMLSMLQSEGIIDESLATALAGRAHGDLISKNMPAEGAFSDGARRVLNGAAAGSTYLFQAAEKLNRRVVALAAYRLARAKGMDNNTSLSEAREALRTTQFEYARWNRAAFMRGKAGVLFVFMQYLQNVLYFTARDPGNVRYLLMMLMAAGLQGLPGAEDLMDTIDWGATKIKRLTGSADPRVDIRKELRRLIISLDMSPELLMHGGSAQSFGLGLPAISDMLGTSLPSFSFESSISAGRVIPGWQSLMNLNRMSGGGAVEGAKDILGAAITIPINMLRWTGDFDPSVYRKFERAAPSVLKGAARALRAWDEKGLRDRGGNLIVDFDQENPSHIAELVGMGLFAMTPTRVIRAQEARFSDKEILQYYRELRGYLLADFYFAMDQKRNGNGSDDEVKNVRQAIRQFNKEAPRGQQLIDIGGAYARHRISIARDRRGLSGRTLDTPTLRENQATFPAATDERIR